MIKYYAFFTACRYSKGEWSSCQDGVKTKTLIRLEGSVSECRQMKTVTKPCGNKKKIKKLKSNRGKPQA
jgi:PTN/MK heparin-binding protein family, C-terminal domain